METPSEGTVRNSNGRLTANSGRQPREKVTILRKKFSLPFELAARRIEVYDIGNNATLAGYANTTEIPVPAAGWGATQKLRELVRRYQQGRTMLKHWLIDLIGHVSGLSDAQLREIEKSLPATKALIDLLNRAQPIIEQAQSLYAEAEPLIDEAKKEWQTVGPAAQILIDVISHHVNQGSSPAEAAEAVRTALDGSIKSVAQDHWMDREIRCVTVFGGTGFVGRRVAHYLRGSGATVRIASRHPGQSEGNGLEQIAADAHDERSVEAAVVDADGVVNAISLYVEHGRDTFHSVHVEAAARIARVARRAGIKRFVHLSGLGGLSIGVYSQPCRRRSGRAERIPWRSYYSPGGNVRAGRRLSYDNSQATSVLAGLSDVRRREDEAPASVRGRCCCGDRRRRATEQKALPYL
jgi:putative NAD(P)-binding protein